MNKDLTVGKPSAVLWQFCLPLFGSIIFQQIYNIADSLVAGKFVGEDALAAVGNSYEITLIFIAFAFGCNIGCSVVVSQLFGARQYSEMKTAVRTAMLGSAVLCLVLCGCSPSPTAITVGTQKVDLATYAFYIHYNLMNLSTEYGYTSDTLYSDEMTSQIKEDALDQTVTAQIIRLKCEELGLSLDDEELQSLEDDKKEFIESLGGKYAYLDFLRESALTDRSYDAFQEDSLYYDKLYEYLCAEATEYYTDENLRQFFSENYINVKYIRLSIVDENGNTIS